VKTYLENNRYYLIVNERKADIYDVLFVEDINFINNNTARYQITPYREYIDYLCDYILIDDNIPYIYINMDFFNESQKEILAFINFMIHTSVVLFNEVNEVETVEHEGRLYAPIEINYN
jgi:hypothetical protein